MTSSDAGIQPVDFVDDNDDLVPQLQRAFCSTNRVCGMALGGVYQQQNAVDHLKIRSTSPPKSAWPGVSTILIL